MQVLTRGAASGQARNTPGRLARRCLQLQCPGSLWRAFAQQPLSLRGWTCDTVRCESSSGAFAKAQAGPGATVRLSETTTLLRNHSNGASICLVGSIHTLRDSAEEIRGWIRATQPRTVAVELDEPALARVVRSLRERRQQRFARARLRAGLRRHLRSLGLPAALCAHLASGGATGVYGLAALLHDQFFAYSIDMSTAAEEAALCSARIVHCDRSQNVTVSRLALSLAGFRIQALWQTDGLESLDATGGLGSWKSRDSVKAVQQWLRRFNPRMAQVLMDERDEARQPLSGPRIALLVMVNNLSKLTGTAVAVVGMAHLDGIERLWEARQAQHTAGAAAAKAWQPKELSHPLGGELSGL